ncbi:MAG TPA: hypothetical protein VNC84_01295 [Gammaproteobacteria bacterium]|jgi:hypothetical protein|nr:hypothetical protein [Gammaproteobacteria bacterium]
MTRHHRFAGVTLVETLLVLVIIAGFVYLSFKTYFAFKVDSDVAAVKTNVDAIFSAMSGYYRANCDSITNSDGKVVPGTLNPISNPRSPFAINIPSDLVGNAFLTNALIPSPVVLGGESGYVAQFNLTMANRYMCIEAADPDQPVTSPVQGKGNCAVSKPIGIIVIWRMQVAVRVDPAMANAYLALLGGDCLSRNAGGIVTDCAKSANNQGDYVVWERLSNASNAKASSAYQFTMPLLVQFKQMYQNNRFMDVTEGSEQYFLCTN